MSKISAELIDDELIIRKIDRHREGDNDIQRINLADLVINREYEAKVKASNRSQNNKIILMHEVSNEYALDVAVRNAIKLTKSEREIESIKNEFSQRNDEDKIAVCVYVKDNVLCYSYGDLNQIYKNLIEFIYKIVSVNLNRNGISIFLYLYIINRFKFDITDKRIEICDSVKKDVTIHEVTNKISKLKIPFSKYRARIKIDKSELEKDEIPINNEISIKMNVKGQTVSYRLGKPKIGIDENNFTEYYFPMSSMYDDEYAMHIRRDQYSNLVFVKRLKEPVENTFKFKVLENKVSSFLMYKLGKFLKKRRNKKINLYYEKFAGKAEEGVFDLCLKCNESERTDNYFIIDKDSPDYDKIKDYEFVVPKYSFKYYWLLYNSNHFISSESPIQINIIRSNNKYLRKALYEKEFIFLQHGVTYLKAHEQNSPYGKGKEAEPNYMVVGSQKEKYAVCDMLGIFEEKLLKSGLPIFDTIEYEHINNQTDDFITVMFTWKHYEEDLHDFRESSYYKNVIKTYDLLSKYIDTSKISIIPHPKVFDSLMNTEMKDSLWQGPISEILTKSKLLITDYSSVAYNSFYQGAGVIFYQPDLKVYERETGNLIPDNDEYIGKRIFKIDELEDVIKETVVDGKINLDKVRTEEFKEIYKTINEFSDGKNIERLYQKLMELKLI